MKKNYTLQFILLFLSYFTYGQNCAVQKAVSDDTICTGQTATIVLSAADAGITYELRDGITIVSSQTPTTSGNLSFTVNPVISTNYTIYDVTNSCFYTDLGIVTVNPVPDVFASNSSQTKCSGAIDTMVLTSSLAGTTFNWTRNNTVNVTGIANSGSGDISGTLTNTTFATQTIIFTITPTSSNGCIGTPINTTVTLYATPNINITNSNQTKCSGNITTMTSSSSLAGTTFSWIRDNTTDVTGTIGASGNGNSISGSLINNTTINQTVIFTITPISANGCVGIPTTATIVVNPKPTVIPSLTTQSVCNGDPISAIVMSSDLPNTTYTWTRNNTINVTGMPNSGTIDNISTFDISGSLINSLTTNQNVTFFITPISEDGCSGTMVTSLITVFATPVAAASTPSQTRCSGVALGSFGITPATYSWIRDNITNVSGANSGSNSANPLTGLVLTNNTTATQIVNFSVTPLNAFGCSGSPITVTATIYPRPNVTANLTSQTICSGDAIADINFSGNVTGTTFSWTQSGTNIDFSGITTSPGSSISGVLTNTSTTPRTATFTITPSYSGCNGTSITVTVLVNPKPNAASVTNTNQTICSGTSIVPIVVTQSVNPTSFSWGRDNTTNVTGIANSGTLSNLQSIAGQLTNTTGINQTVTFTITPEANGCSGNIITATIVVEPNSLGGTLSLTPVPASPLNNIITACHTSGTGTIYLTGERGLVVRWESSSNAGATWTSINNTANTYTYDYPNVSVSMLYRAIVKNGTCPEAPSKVAVINVIPNIKPTPVTATPPTICNGDSSVLTSVSGYATSGSVASGGTFNSSNPPGWAVGSCGNCLNAGSSNTNPNPWQLSATNGGTYSGVNYTSDNKFAIANGAFTSYLYTPTFNTYGLSSASLTFADSYNILAGASIAIQISVNGGPYNSVWSVTGPATRTPSLNFHLNGRSIDLSEYLGQPNLRIRFVYFGNVGSSWAVDNIAIPDAPQNLTYIWIDPITGNPIPNQSTATLTVTPTTTTTYAVASNLNGCIGFDDPNTPAPNTDGIAYVTVTVNPRPTAIISQDQYVCYNNPATLTVHFTGTGPFRFTLKALNTVTNTVTNTVYNNITPNASGNYTFNTPNLTATMVYSITALNDTKCASITDDIDDSTVTVTVLDGTPGVWTGRISTDWFDCKNWERGLPTATVDAVIPTVPIGGRMPVIDNASSFAAANSYIAIARNLIINVGARVSMDSINALTPNLHIKGDWRNSGRFYPGRGTVTFNSSTANFIQYMNTASENNFYEEYWNLTLNCTNTARGVITQNFFKLLVRNNLVLTSGDLRLTGEAQLLQKGSAPNPVGGTGVLMRDQQGTKSSYHYNYWSPPVTPLGGTTYTIAGVLRDGSGVTTANQFTATAFNKIAIDFGVGYDFADGPLSSPIKISERWLHKYTAVSTSYYSWQPIGSTGNVTIGEGFTMKGVTGTAPNTDYQNYVFVGKPNNGDINLNMSLNQLYLVGNPYPSALDANAFITDNVLDNGTPLSNVFNGALYFWDHFGGNTHYLNQYIGGYATYNLSGGVKAISNDPLINNNNNQGSKTPQRYIPVAQGFFIRTDIAGPAQLNPITNPITGGTVKFRNSQRAFKTESPTNSIFIKSSNNTVSEDIDNRQKIRLGYDTASGLHRQLLVTADSHASNQFDIKYDASMVDVNQNDMYWNISNGKFVIQGVPDFNPSQIIPLGVKITTTGVSKIKIDALENIPASTEIYVFDNVTGNYHDIKNEELTMDLPAGEYNDRFSLRFTTTTLSADEIVLNNGIMVFNDSNNVLNIKNNLSDVKVEFVQLYNILGQSVAKWDVSSEAQQNIKIQVEHVRSGAYIVKLKTSNGSLSKKVIIR